MTLKDAIDGVMRLIDEDTLEEDLLAKLLSFLDMGQKEIMMQAPLLRTAVVVWPPAAPPPAAGVVLPAEDSLPLPQDYFRMDAVYSLSALGEQALYSRWREAPVGRLIFEDAGDYLLEYEAYPLSIDEKTAFTQELPLPPEAHTALLFYAAAQYALSDGDYQAQYGKFFAMYQGRMANLLAERRLTARVVGGLAL